MWAALFLIVLAIQISVGAYGTERGNYPDEAAHFMNGLLVREYLRAAAELDPLQFAEQYYVQYPKIAPLIWPPLFHALLGIVLLPPWPAHAAALALVAAATAWASWRLFVVTSRLTHPVIGATAAVLFLSTAIIVDLTSAVMLDVVVAAFALEATYWFARFLAAGRRRHAFLFGIFAAGGCLTKANGFAIVLVPPLAILLARRFDLLRDRGLWLAAALVIVTAGPPLVFSYVLDVLSGGDFALVTARQVVDRTAFYLGYLGQQLGAIAIGLAAAGAAAAACRARVRSERPALAAALAVLVVAGLIFHIFNPVQVSDGRYVALMVAPFVALLAHGACILSASWRHPGRRRAAAFALFAAAAVNFVIAKPAATERRPIGYRELVRFLEVDSGLQGRRVLVVSDEHGEGAFVSEVAARQPIAARITVIRGSKLMGREDWDGRNFRAFFSAPAEILQELESLQVAYVVVDSAAPHRYLGAIHGVVAQADGRLEQLRTSSTANRQITVYRLRHAGAHEPKRLRIHVNPLRRAVLEQERPAAAALPVAAGRPRHGSPAPPGRHDPR
ncbi:MAG TPA: glycosyltransferase family 39 protein [Vicinamibacterales bacterium]|nr:glycosyltransferase family 39 protein [Vicinamibacterales bacterium]